MRQQRKSHALRRRYGRAFTGPQAISYPTGDGTTVDVLEVDHQGTVLRKLASRIPYSLAKTIIKRRHR